ncbi:glycosyltransferase family 2 protein [Salinimicrobium oceani]|uniref:Glycosyltransferase n=1 Tax=Salinimicrobium oceani TaxID=2722702 RepID=A0ABX1D0R7_9FLAO|nr:glycosyltransferase [Salinimicrobium oceani]NJW53662.1 glycosyltransferase [Salinimicrobium oceani]
MRASVLIVSRNRREELLKTLNILHASLDPALHEIRVFLDGCTDTSHELMGLMPRIKWETSEIPLGASKSRSILYKKALGKILYGFDDDAHPLQENFIEITEELFNQNPGVGIIGYKEIKGQLQSRSFSKENVTAKKQNLLVKDFLGCGFAIKKSVYDSTRGFPEWIDIYGEEICLALEALSAGYDIMFTHEVMVHHRKDMQSRKDSGANLFRFEKQLKNTFFFYLVYYPLPLMFKKLLKLYLHNFTKYAVRNPAYFRSFLSATVISALGIKDILRYRKPINEKELKKFSQLPNPDY